MKFSSTKACVLVLLLSLMASMTAQAEGDARVREPALVAASELPDLGPVCCECDSLIVAGNDSCWREEDRHECDGHAEHEGDEIHDDGGAP